ncbi:class I SAM-dependent methyltransferase [Patescibacteria group bacterium]|nr:class I SAM-dependent methyltransferase [Patescibacteria group bacterium]
MKKISSFEGSRHKEIDEKFFQLDMANIGNVIYWEKFFAMIKNVPGDIVECGVGAGRSLTIIAALNHILDKDESGGRVIYGYDSFEGFPEPTAQDDSFRKPKKGEWANSPSGKYKYSPDFIRAVLSEAGVPKEALPVLGKGFFDKILPSHPRRTIAMLHVDGDLYESYRACLENLFDLVSPGGIIIFDDFFGEDNGTDRFPGARAAVKEFLKDEIKNLRPTIRGNYYYVKK